MLNETQLSDIDRDALQEILADLGLNPEQTEEAISQVIDLREPCERRKS